MPVTANRGRAPLRLTMLPKRWGGMPCVNTIKASFSPFLSLVSSATGGRGSIDMKLSRTIPGRSGYATGGPDKLSYAR